MKWALSTRAEKGFNLLFYLQKMVKNFSEGKEKLEKICFGQGLPKTKCSLEVKMFFIV